MAFLRLLGGISPILLSEKMSRETLVEQQSESGRLLSLLRLFRIFAIAWALPQELSSFSEASRTASQGRLSPTVPIYHGLGDCLQTEVK